MERGAIELGLPAWLSFIGYLGGWFGRIDEGRLLEIILGLLATADIFPVGSLLLGIWRCLLETPYETLMLLSSAFAGF